MNIQEFEVVISSDPKSDRSSFKKLWEYRDLIVLLVRRDFVAGYKQTILGPSWALIHPLLSTLMTALVFGGIAGLSPEGTPVFLFYLSGQIFWAFFSGCVHGTSWVFVDNANLMSKVYFPRFAVPVASCISKMIPLVMQSILFAILYAGYMICGVDMHPDLSILLMPVYLLHTVLLALGTGAAISSLTTKYRDAVLLVSYFLTLWMYISPVVYDAGLVPERFRWLYMLNPVSPLLTQIRYALFRQGDTCWPYYLLSAAMTVAILFAGIRLFDRAQRTFPDTI